MLSSWYHKSSPPLRPNIPGHLLSVLHDYSRGSLARCTDTLAVAFTSIGNLH